MIRVVALTPLRHGGRLVPAGTPLYVAEHTASLLVDSGRARVEGNSPHEAPPPPPADAPSREDAKSEGGAPVESPAKPKKSKR